MREVGEISKHLTGDIKRASAYISQARTKLGILKNSMQATGLLQLSDSHIVDGDVVITVSSMFGSDSVEIHAPEVVGPAVEEKKEGVEEPAQVAQQHFFDITLYTYNTVCEEPEDICVNGLSYVVYTMFLIPDETTIKFLAYIFRNYIGPSFGFAKILIEYENKYGVSVQEELHYYWFHRSDVSHLTYDTEIPYLSGTDIDDKSCTIDINSAACGGTEVPRAWELDEEDYELCIGVYGAEEEDVDQGYLGDYVDGSRARLIAVMPTTREWYYLDREPDNVLMYTFGDA